MGKALGAALTTVLLAVTLTVVGAPAAHAASLGCVTLNGAGSDPCTHQTSIEINLTSTSYSANGSRHDWWGPFTVLRMQKDNNLVLYCQSGGRIGRAVWASNTVGANYDAGVTFGGLGHVKVWRTNWRTNPANPGAPPFLATSNVWDSNTDTGGAGAQLLVQADGNLVIWNTTFERAMWASNTYHACGNGDQNYWVGYR
ncbi:hypothetical protein [Embleya sp. MST-111070]|uniref:hypothetical protein n=1 Tax=Embleya sp. MST-111070 TaxID=3398231 RepID=UPI003F7345A2